MQETQECPSSTVNICAPAERLNELVARIMTDDSVQREFESNPRGVLESFGISLPDDVIPDRLDIRAIISDMERVNEALAAPYVRVGVVVAVAVAPVPTAVLSSLEKESVRGVFSRHAPKSAG